MTKSRNLPPAAKSRISTTRSTSYQDGNAKTHPPITNLASQYASVVRSCRTCEISSYCSTRVLPTVYKPVDVLFVGEAPGASEHIIGKPFVGPAGYILNEIITESLPTTVSYAITNAILCTPFEDETLTDIRTPSLSEVNGCRVHLERYIQIVKPKKIVALGKVAERSLKKLVDTYTTILHPSAIAQSTHYSYELQRAIVKLRGMFK